MSPLVILKMSYILHVIIYASECARPSRYKLEWKRKAITTPLLTCIYISLTIKFDSYIALVMLKRWQYDTNFDSTKAASTLQDYSRTPIIPIGPTSFTITPSSSNLIGLYSSILLHYLRYIIGSTSLIVQPFSGIPIGSLIWTNS